MSELTGVAHKPKENTGERKLRSHLLTLPSLFQCCACRLLTQQLAFEAILTWVMGVSSLLVLRQVLKEAKNSSVLSQCAEAAGRRYQPGSFILCSASTDLSTRRLSG